MWLNAAANEFSNSEQTRAVAVDVPHAIKIAAAATASNVRQ